MKDENSFTFFTSSFLFEFSKNLSSQQTNARKKSLSLSKNQKKVNQSKPTIFQNKMLEFLDSGKRVVKLPTKVELTSLSPVGGNLFEFKKSQFHVIKTSKKNVKTLLYRIYYTYENETQCVLSQSVKAYPKDGRFYVLALTFKIVGTYRIEFSAGEKEKIERVVHVVESEKIIKMRKAQEEKKLKEMEEKKMEEKNRKKKKEEEKKKKRSRQPRNRKQKSRR